MLKLSTYQLDHNHKFCGFGKVFTPLEKPQLLTTPQILFPTDQAEHIVSATQRIALGVSLRFEACDRGAYPLGFC
jgi:hypothetical protein